MTTGLTIPILAEAAPEQEILKNGLVALTFLGTLKAPQVKLEVAE